MCPMYESCRDRKGGSEYCRMGLSAVPSEICCMRNGVFVVIVSVLKRMGHMAVLCHVCPHTWRLFAHMSIHHRTHPQIFTEYLVCPGTDLTMGIMP